MKIKTVFKILAIVITTVMTICMTACEDERNVPAYGTGISEDGGTSVRHNLSPTAPVETEPAPDFEADAFIQYADIAYDEEFGEYIFVYVVMTNNTDEKIEAWKLAMTGAYDDNGLVLDWITEPISGDKHEDVQRLIKPHEQDFVIHKFGLPDWDTEFLDITVTVWDNSTQTNVVVDSQRFYLTEE